LPAIVIGFSLLFTIAHCCSNEEGVMALWIFNIITCIILAIGINAKVTKRKGIIVTTATKSGKYNSKIDFSGKLWIRLGIFFAFAEIFMTIIFLATREMYLEPTYWIYTLLGSISLIATIFFATYRA